jgi:hypothetical protein
MGIATSLEKPLVSSERKQARVGAVEERGIKRLCLFL